ncbi:sulfite exporter TauE/SafE family protein [Ammoniphilus sp. YIM 78166]|uniref:sulfite exporter TauE/SafE family protein n=1 Tax=Ammoniphilus sp. YIM 78166 TaxID=1644106 RepID=UPI0010706693|nr:sulfite exporter TauE/SafE family protein [Ammoniphilus sp. YIM 78166]
MSIFLTMFFTGILLGFTGAGGAGFMISILVTFFNIPIHTALATAMAAMFLTVVSGAFSHFREGNLELRSGIVAGLFGAAAAYAGTQVAHHIPGEQLIVFTAAMLLLSALILWLRTRWKLTESDTELTEVRSWRLKSAGIGLATGGMSGLFGVGSAPFIQVGLLIFLRKSLKIAAGTTMLIILPTALFASIGYYQSGHLDPNLLAKVVSGSMIGSYIGAKFTKHAPVSVLRIFMISAPLLSGLLLLF